MGIRWDAVVDPSGVDCREASPSPSRVSVDRSRGPIAAEVRLFGALATAERSRCVTLEVSPDARLADVLRLLGERLGGAFLASVIDESGAKRRHCRLFVGGYAVERLETPLAATADPGKIEIILLVAPEGG